MADATAKIRKKREELEEKLARSEARLREAVKSKGAKGKDDEGPDVDAARKELEAAVAENATIREGLQRLGNLEEVDPEKPKPGAVEEGDTSTPPSLVERIEALPDSSFHGIPNPGIARDQLKTIVERLQTGDNQEDIQKWLTHSVRQSIALSAIGTEVSKAQKEGRNIRQGPRTGFVTDMQPGGTFAGGGGDAKLSPKDIEKSGLPVFSAIQDAMRVPSPIENLKDPEVHQRYMAGVSPIIPYGKQSGNVATDLNDQLEAQRKKENQFQSYKELFGGVADEDNLQNALDRLAVEDQTPGTSRQPVPSGPQFSGPVMRAPTPAEREQQTLREAGFIERAGRGAFNLVTAKGTDPSVHPPKLIPLPPRRAQDGGPTFAQRTTAWLSGRDVDEMLARGTDSQLTGIAQLEAMSNVGLEIIMLGEAAGFAFLEPLERLLLRGRLPRDVARELQRFGRDIVTEGVEAGIEGGLRGSFGRSAAAARKRTEALYGKLLETKTVGDFIVRNPRLHKTMNVLLDTATSKGLAQATGLALPFAAMGAFEPDHTLPDDMQPNPATAFTETMVGFMLMEAAFMKVLAPLGTAAFNATGDGMRKVLGSQVFHDFVEKRLLTSLDKMRATLDGVVSDEDLARAFEDDFFQFLRRTQQIPFRPGRARGATQKELTGLRKQRADVKGEIRRATKEKARLKADKPKGFTKQVKALNKALAEMRTRLVGFDKNIRGLEAVDRGAAKTVGETGRLGERHKDAQEILDKEFTKRLQRGLGREGEGGARLREELPGRPGVSDRARAAREVRAQGTINREFVSSLRSNLSTDALGAILKTPAEVGGEHSSLVLAGETSPAMEAFQSRFYKKVDGLPQSDRFFLTELGKRLGVELPGSFNAPGDLQEIAEVIRAFLVQHPEYLERTGLTDALGRGGSGSVIRVIDDVLAKIYEPKGRTEFDLQVLTESIGAVYGDAVREFSGAQTLRELTVAYQDALTQAVAATQGGRGNKFLAGFMRGFSEGANQPKATASIIDDVLENAGKTGRSPARSRKELEKEGVAIVVQQNAVQAAENAALAARDKLERAKGVLSAAERRAARTGEGAADAIAKEQRVVAAEARFRKARKRLSEARVKDAKKTGSEQAVAFAEADAELVAAESELALARDAETKATVELMKKSREAIGVPPPTPEELIALGERIRKLEDELMAVVERGETAMASLAKQRKGSDAGLPEAHVSRTQLKAEVDQIRTIAKAQADELTTLKNQFAAGQKALKRSRTSGNRSQQAVHDAANKVAAAERRFNDAMKDVGKKANELSDSLRAGGASKIEARVLSREAPALDEIAAAEGDTAAQEIANQINPSAGVVNAPSFDIQPSAATLQKAKELMVKRILARGGPAGEGERVILESYLKKGAPVTETPPAVLRAEDEFEALATETAKADGDDLMPASEVMGELRDISEGRLMVESTKMNPKRRKPATDKLAQLHEELERSGFRLRVKRPDSPAIGEEPLTPEQLTAFRALQRHNEAKAQLDKAVSELDALKKIGDKRKLATKRKHVANLQRGVDSTRTVLGEEKKRALERSVRGPLDRDDPRRLQFYVEDETGKPLFRSNSIRDALQEARNRGVSPGKRLLSAGGAEALAQTALADNPNDDTETKNLKLALRSALRIGSALAVLPVLGAPKGEGNKLWSAFTDQFYQRFRIEDSFLGTQGLQSVATKLKDMNVNIWSKVYFKGRNPEELIRHMPERVREGFAQFFSRSRALQRDWLSWHTFIRDDLRRLGIRAGKDGKPSYKSEGIGAILDVVPNRALQAIPDSLVRGTAERSLSKEVWVDALRRSHRAGVDLGLVTSSKVQRELFEDALKRLTVQDFRVAKEIGSRFARLRAAEVKATSEKFVGETGRENPWIIIDDRGRWRARAATEADANELVVNIKAKTNDPDPSFVVKRQIEPHKAEIESRLGPDVSAYMPRIVYDSMRSRYNIDGLVDQAPWADPIIMLEKFQHWISLADGRGGFTAAREQILADYGRDLPTSAIKDLLVSARAAVGMADSVVNRQAIQSIPRDIYVQFYKQRFSNDPTYSRDVVRGLNSYVSTVLRDIHLGPGLAPLAKSIQAAQLKGTNSALLENLIKNVDYIIGREQPLSKRLGQLVGKTTGAAYRGILWARSSPAMNNLIGQTFLVGLPEMGADSSIAALVALTSKDTWHTLSKVPAIWNALPFGDRTPWDALRRLRESRTPREAVGRVGDTVDSFLDLLGLSEVAIRGWSFLGGFIEAAKRRGMLSGPFPGGKMVGKPAAFEVRQFFKTVEKLSVEKPKVMESMLLEAEDMVRRTAFFFEAGSMPRAFQNLKNFPFGGMFTMFANFPLNYTNRLVSLTVDAFKKGTPPGTRRAAWGKIIRHLNMTVLIGGPMALPIINEMVRNVSTQDASLGSRLKAAIEPYQNYWANTLNKLGPVAQAHTSRDLQKFSTLQPPVELFNPRRFQNATVPGALYRLGRAGYAVATKSPASTSMQREVGGHLFGTNIPIEPIISEELERDTMKALGDLSPYFGFPDPEGTVLPESLALFIPGGGSFQDWMNMLHDGAAQRAGLDAPLDRHHRLRPKDDALSRLFLGPGQAARDESNRVREIAERDSHARRIVDDAANALVNPLVEKGGREYNRALDRLSDAGLVDSITPELQKQTLLEQSLPPSSRRMLTARIDTIMKMEEGVRLAASADVLADIPSKAEKRRRMLLHAIVQVRLKRHREAQEKKKKR